MKKPPNLLVPPERDDAHQNPTPKPRRIEDASMSDAPGNELGGKTTHCTPAFERSLEGFRVFQNVECGLARNTIEAYRRDLRRFGDFLRRSSIDAWDRVIPQIIQGHLVEVSRCHYKETTIARHVVAIRMWLKWLHLTKQIPDDVTALLDLPRCWSRLPETLNLERTSELVTSPDLTGPLGLRDRAMLELLYACGLRVSELCGLSERDVNLSIGYVRCMGKGRRERVVPIGQKAKDALEAYREHLRPKLLQKRLQNGPDTCRYRESRPPCYGRTYAPRWFRPVAL